MTWTKRRGPTPRPRGLVADGRWRERAGAAAAGLAILAAAGLPARADAGEALLREEDSAADTALARVAGWPFPSRERFRYAVRLGRLQLGRGRIASRPDTVLPGVDAHRVSLTIDVGAAFAEIHDRHVAWLAADPLRTLVVEPVIPALDVFGEDRDARIWLSDDERRLIVRVESVTRVGPLQLHLRRYGSGEE